jgi:hypothetical protein
VGSEEKKLLVPLEEFIRIAVRPYKAFLPRSEGKVIEAEKYFILHSRLVELWTNYNMGSGSKKELELGFTAVGDHVAKKYDQLMGTKEEQKDGANKDNN